MRWIRLSIAVVAVSIAACMSGRGPAVTQAKTGPASAMTAAYASADPGVIDRDATPRDPVALLEEALVRCDRDVRDYECVFERRERIGGRLYPAQRMRVRYNDHPRTVHMVWLDNIDQVRQAWYAEGENLSAAGDEQVIIEPAGRLLRAVAGRIAIDAHGDLARRSSRFTIDQFGFRSTLERILDGIHRFEAGGVMRIDYAGTGRIGGRATHVIVRRLPYDGPDGPYPEAKLIVHLDRQTLMPVAVYCYADPGEQVLLASYVTTQVTTNTGWRSTSDGI